MKNLDKPEVPSENEGYFFTTKTGCKLFVYDFQPIENYSKTIFIISGITMNQYNAVAENAYMRLVFSTFCHFKFRFLFILK